MIVGVILVGCGVGAVAALSALVLGQGLLMALLIYSGTGVLAVLLGALRAALRPDPAPRSDPEIRPARLQRG